MNRRELLKTLAGIVVLLAGYSNPTISAPANGCFRQIIDGLWLVKDTCNVYLIKDADRAIAIDFGSGQWLEKISQIGIKHLDHVFLTHHHADQCSGLQARSSWPFTIHAPYGDERFLDPKRLSKQTATRRIRKGCPASYSVIKAGIAGIKYDMRSFSDVFWGTKRIRFMKTPGHGPNACSVIIDQDSRQIVFCGDAAYEGGTLWHPFNLEWDHWTGDGAIAAWRGVKQLADVRMDLLCPSHGPVIFERPQKQLKLLAQRLMDFYNVKNSISPGEKDLYIEPEEVLVGREPSGAGGAHRISPHLYHFGRNGYLLVSSTGEGLIVDPQIPDMKPLKQLLEKLPDVRLTAVTVSHYHADHCDGIGDIRKSYSDVKVYLHPLVAEPLGDIYNTYVPWLPRDCKPIIADELWPEHGIWRWNEYEFEVSHASGQTWWHCAFMTKVDGQKVYFSGDTFQPNTRWNATGGFCAYNGCRFSNGYIPTCKLILSWKPDIVAAGHETFWRFSPSKFLKVIEWARRAEKAITQLCPDGDIEGQYYSLGVRTDKNIKAKPDVRLLKNESYAW